MPPATGILLGVLALGLLAAPMTMRPLLAIAAALAPLAAAAGCFWNPGIRRELKKWPLLRWAIPIAGLAAGYWLWTRPWTKTALWMAGILAAWCALRLIRDAWRRTGGDPVLRFTAGIAAAGMLILVTMLLYRHNPIGFLAAADLYGGFCGLLGLVIWACDEKTRGK